MINFKNFYLILAIVMLIIVLANIWNLISNWAILVLPSKISSIGEIIFNFMFVALFFYLYKTTIDMTPDEDKINEFINEKLKGG